MTWAGANSSVALAAKRIAAHNKPAPKKATGWGGLASYDIRPRATAPAQGGAAAASGGAQGAQGAAGAAGAPGAGPTDLPFDQGAEVVRSNAQTTYDVNRAALAARQDLLDRQYGARGGVLDFENPADPWSRSGVLRRQWFAQREQQTAGNFGSGTGYDGSSELRDAMLAADQGQQAEQLRRDYQNDRGRIAQDLTGTTDDLTGTSTDLDTRITNAFGNDLTATAGGPSRAPTPAAPATVPTPAKPKTKAKAKTASSKPTVTGQSSQGKPRGSQTRKPARKGKK